MSLGMRMLWKWPDVTSVDRSDGVQHKSDWCVCVLLSLSAIYSETAVAYSRYYSRICFGKDWGKPQETASHWMIRQRFKPGTFWMQAISFAFVLKSSSGDFKLSVGWVIMWAGLVQSVSDDEMSWTCRKTYEVWRNRFGRMGSQNNSVPFILSGNSLLSVPVATPQC